jgi:hypothetical protein
MPYQTMEGAQSDKETLSKTTGGSEDKKPKTH